jgi:hypothetical protein
MKHKTADIVAAILEMKRGLSVIEVETRLRKRFLGLDDAKMDRALDIAIDEIDEMDREVNAETAVLNELRGLFVGLPKGMTLGEAAKIKAAHGDPIALKFLAHDNSPAVRIQSALVRAAYDAHPLFSREARGNRWNGEGEAPSETAMIDWFQKNHPAEARRIEKEIDGSQYRSK